MKTVRRLPTGPPRPNGASEAPEARVLLKSFLIKIQIPKIQEFYWCNNDRNMFNQYTYKQIKHKKDMHTRHATQTYVQKYFAKPYGGISASKMIYPYFTDSVYLLKGERKMVS